MQASTRAAGSNRRGGFTLIEVMLATVLLAAAGTSIVAIYLHSSTQAAASRDLNIATSVARNQVEEGIAFLVQDDAIDEPFTIDARPSLAVTYSEEPIPPDVKDVTTENFGAVVAGEDGKVIEFKMKRAIYQLPPKEDGTPGATGGAGFGSGGAAAEGVSNRTDGARGANDSGGYNWSAGQAMDRLGGSKR